MKLSNNSEKSKILIIRLSSMGDVILTTALVRQLRKRFPDSRIDYVTARPFADILRYNPYLNNIIKYDKSALRSEINRQKQQILDEYGQYDFIIDLQRNLRSRHFRNGLGGEVFTLQKNRLHKLSLVYLKKPLIKRHVAENYFNAGLPLGITDDGLGLEFWLESDKEYPNEGALNIYKPVVAVAPGAHFFTKRWPREYFIELIKMIHNKYDASFKLIGGPEDMALCGDIQKALPFQIDNLAGKLSISESAEAVDSSDIVITNDSGVMHIAAARRKPVLAFFGSTVTELGFAPWRVKNRIVEADVKCRPCSHIGKNSCPKKHFRCMMDITPEKAFSNFADFLNELK